MFKGIDISKYQENVDYSKLKEQGIEFAIIRCGYGKEFSQKDELFEQHYKGLKENGIAVGCYLYSYCTCLENAVKEAENCLKIIEGKTFELPIFYDLEENRTRIMGKELCTKVAKNFCEKIISKGYKAGIYANLDWYNNCLNVKELEKYYIWLAQWTEKHTATFKVDFWQYSSKGQILGINGNVDLDISYLEINKNKKSDEEIAKEVITGLWGNGEERKKKLEQAGYNYLTIQEIVNSIMKNHESTVSVGEIYYTVKKGDNLTKISKAYGTTISEIVKLNNIKNPDKIYVNQVLRIK